VRALLGESEEGDGSDGVTRERGDMSVINEKAPTRRMRGKRELGDWWGHDIEPFHRSAKKIQRSSPPTADQTRDDPRSGTKAKK